MAKLLVILMMALGGMVAHGESIIEVDEIRDRARNRLYPGGVDEEDLQVQPSLVNPIRKIFAKSIQAEVLKIKPQVEEGPDGE